MKKLITFIFIFSLLCVVTPTFAKNYTFGTASNLVKVTTTQTSANIVVTSNQTSNQRFYVSVWSSGTSGIELIKKEIIFNTPPPRSTTFTLGNLNPASTYWLYIENAGQTSTPPANKIETEAITPYLCPSCKLEVSIANNKITAKLSGADVLLRDKLKILLQSDAFIVGRPLCTGVGEPFMCSNQPVKDVALGGVVTWTIPTDGLLGRTDYNIRVEAESPLTLGSYYVSSSKTVKTGDEGVKATGALQLTYKVNGDTADISGAIDNPRPADFSANSKLQYSLKQFDANGETLPPEAKEVTATIEADGKYVFKLTDLNPNRLYFVKQILRADNRGAKDISVNNTGFNSTTGYKAEGSQEQLDDYKKRSYTLLAPFSEKLRVVLDPDLCRELVAQGKKTGSCDNQVSDFINLMLSVLIGIAAVVLVVQLIIQGYVLMTTDIPFLRAGAKSRFFEALLGLLLAMSSYLILNTINPKLVSGGLNIASINIGVEEYTTIDPATYERITGQKIKPKPEYIAMVDRLSQQNNIDACVVKASITIESAWRPNIIGCDENARMSDVPSRKAFIASGIRYDGTKFSERDIGSSVKNVCPSKVDPSKPGLGLDWRFSKGGGLMQKTLFPDGYKSEAWYQGVKENGIYWNKRTTPFPGFEALINPERNIQLGIDLLKSGIATCGSIEKAYRQYGSGSCSGSGQLLNDSVAKKMREYQVCKSGDPSYK
jgi:hypothetical protein